MTCDTTEDTDTIILTKLMIKAGLTAGIGINSVQAAILGIDWPLKKGWNHRLYGARVSRHAFLDYIAHKGKERVKPTRLAFIPPWLMD